MSAWKASIEYPEDVHLDPAILVRLQPPAGEYFGEPADLALVLHTRVKDGRAVHKKRTMGKIRTTIQGPEVVARFPLGEDIPYEYDGESIRQDLQVRVAVGSWKLFRKAREKIDVVLTSHRRPARAESEEIIDPEDDYDLVAALKSVSVVSRILIVLALLCFPVIVIPLLAVGVHDQFAAEANIWLLPRSNQEAQHLPPLLVAVGIAVLLFASMGFLVQNRLQSYMRFHAGPIPSRITRDTPLRAADLVRGRARVDLHHATVRIIASNIECGQHYRGSGKDRRTRSFETPVGAFVWYEEQIERVPKGQPIHHSLTGSLDPAEVFRLLHPPCMTGKRHGIKVYWEAQLLSDELADLELPLPADSWVASEFFAPDDRNPPD